MKTITVPGKTTSIGVRLTPTPTTTGTASICNAPVGLVAFDSEEWLDHIAFRKQEWGNLAMMVPIALKWSDTNVCANDIIAWSVVGSNSPFDGWTPVATIHGAANGSSAALYTTDYGTFTVAATVGGSIYQAIIEIWQYVSEGWYRGTNLLP